MGTGVSVATSNSERVGRFIGGRKRSPRWSRLADLLEVEAGAERRPVAGEHDRPDVAVLPRS